MTCTTVQLQAHDVCNCTITAEIRPADDQSDSRILIYVVVIIIIIIIEWHHDSLWVLEYSQEIICLKIKGS